MLPAHLAEILVCPKTKQRLVYFPRGESDDGDGFLLSVDARLRYRIDDGVPVLLVDEAEDLTAEETRRLVDRARQLGLLASNASDPG